jgi:hypothetical protein
MPEALETQVNDVSDVGGSDLETDTSADEYEVDSDKYSDYISGDETETTAHSGENISDTESEGNSDDDNDIACAFQSDIKGNMPTKYMSKTQRRHVRRNLHEIGEAFSEEAKKTNQSFVIKMPRQINDKPRPRKPGPWRVVEIFTWTAMITMVAGTMMNWDAYEPITLPNWDLMVKQVRDDAMRYIERVDIDLAVIAWPCTPWSIMQNLNQKPHQIRNIKLQQEEHRTLLLFVEQVAHRQYLRKRASLGENPAGSHAWQEPPIQSAFNRPGNSETVTHMCCYNKRRPDTGQLVKKATRLRGTKR